MKRLLLAAFGAAFLAGAVQAGEIDMETWHTQQTQFLADNAKRDGWNSTPSGLQFHPLTSASGDAPRPRPGAEVAVHYEGRLINGAVFDSSYDRGQPAVFPLDGVIQGWQEGVPMMRAGDVWEFAIPAELAYGERELASIPAGSTLIFKIELLAIRPGDEAVP